ncbi:hypothetical protein [Escherichia coli]|uniref:hypothetical protein n=1 Tax=Escherichia coli TaxID=562 RepID=UPI0003915B60|nr:hypothetical protein G879_02243 [Escherichia coli KOEGE 7 (16a)]
MYSAYPEHASLLTRFKILRATLLPCCLHTTRRHFHETIHFPYPDTTQLELRRELDYLADRKMVELERRPSGDWFADLSRLGVDIVEYTVECGPGIARPEKYWSE